MTLPPRIRTGVVLALAAGALVMAGCSSGSTPGAVTTTSITVPGQTTIPYSPAKNARTDVVLQTPCTQDATGAWVATGTVRNSATIPRAYSIVVDFVNSGATVQDTQIVKVATVASGAQASWSTAGAQGRSGIACVIRQVQFSTSG
jgi:hypothetical protein